MSIDSEFKAKLASKATLFGHWVGIPHVAAVEVMARLPCDFLLVDGEHAPIRPDDLASLMPAADLHGMPVIFRPRSKSEADIKAALDAGVAGIMVPMIETAAEAKMVVDAAKYAPLGKRGIGPWRASGYYDRFADYSLTANDRTTVVVQIESKVGLANVEAISATEGVDVIYVGPADLASSLGVAIGDFSGPLLEACERVAKAGIGAGKRVALDLASLDLVAPLQQLGFSLFTHGSDIGFLQEAGRQTCTALRRDVRKGQDQ